MKSNQHVPTNFDKRQQVWRDKFGGLLFLVTGGGLVFSIVFGIPLWLSVLGGGILAIALTGWIGALRGVDLRRPVSIGLRAGVLATAAYDISRVLATQLLSLNTNPFEAWRYFGAGLVGSSAPIGVQFVVGATFHLTNGLMFAVAYTYWFATKGPVAGVAFAMVLEAFMLGLYPGWLGIASYAPLFAMSMVGHVFYGSTLGALARRWWKSYEKH